MATSVEYNGHILTPATRHQVQPQGWTLEVHVKPVGRKLGGRRCRAPNLYSTEEKATKWCLEFGRRIVDGTVHKRVKG